MDTMPDVQVIPLRKIWHSSVDPNSGVSKIDGLLIRSNIEIGILMG